MSNAIPRNCDDVIVNFRVTTQELVRLNDFKKHVEKAKGVVLTDSQAKVLFQNWLKEVYAKVDGQQVSVDVDLDTDDIDDICIEHFWDSIVDDNVEIPKHWEVARCQTHTTGCDKISVGTYGDDKTPLCEEHKELANYDYDGNLKPEVEAPKVDSVADEMALLRAENASLKERVKTVVKHFENILSQVVTL